MTEIRLLSSLAKVFPHAAPPARPEKEWLSALGGETVSFQVAYLQKRGKQHWTHLRLETELATQMRRVQYIPGHFPTAFGADDGYLHKEAGLFPDLLEPIGTKDKQPGNTLSDRLPFLPGTWRAVWVDVVIPPQAPAGHYPIRLTLENPAGEVLAQAETAVTVVAANLPALDIAHTRWFHTDCLADYYGVDMFSERHWEIIENFAAYAVQHNMNALLTPIHTPPLDTEVGGERTTTQLLDISVEDGRYTFGFDRLQRWVDMCQRVGIKYIEIAHLFTQWGAKHAPKIMGTKDGTYTRLFGWETAATGPEYTAYLQQMLPALTAKLREWGVAEKTFFHISDEPNMSHLEDYAAARNIIKPLLEGFKVVDALSNFEFYEQDLVSVPVPSVDYIEPFLEADLPELWCYYCCVESVHSPNLFFMQPSFRNRIIGVLLYKYNLDGFLHWGYNFYRSVHSVYPIDPYRVTDAEGAFPSGDAFVVYPGKDGHPLASLRLMVASEAFNDFRALKLLEEKIGRGAVLEMIDDGLASPLTFRRFPQTEDYLINLRQRVNAKISQQ